MRRYRPGGGGSVRTHGGVAVPDPFAMVRAYDSDTNPARPIRPSPLAASTIQGLPLDLLDRLRSFPLFQAAPDSFLAAVGLPPLVQGTGGLRLLGGDAGIADGESRDGRSQRQAGDDRRAAAATCEQEPGAAECGRPDQRVREAEAAEGDRARERERDVTEQSAARGRCGAGLRLERGVGVAADVVAAVEHQHPLAELGGDPFGHGEAEKSGADDDEIRASRGHA